MSCQSVTETVWKFTSVENDYSELSFICNNVRYKECGRQTDVSFLFQVFMSSVKELFPLAIFVTEVILS